MGEASIERGRDGDGGEGPEPGGRSLSSRLAAWWLGERVPAMSRPAYRRELMATFLFAFALAAVEGGIVSVFTKNAFAKVVDASTLNFMVGMVQAAPELSNLLSFFWASASAGRRKIPFINGLQVSLLAMVMAGSLVPRTHTGLYVFVGMVILARVCWSGILTIRTGVWRANYSRRERAGIVGRFSTVQVVTIAAVGLALGASLDIAPRAYVVLAPSACVLGLGAAMVYRRIRVRGERAWLREELKAEGGEAVVVRTRDPGIAPRVSGPERVVPGVSSGDARTGSGEPGRQGRAGGSAGRKGWGWRGPMTVVRVLKSDPLYAQFQMCMFTLGLGNLMLAALLAIVLRDRFGLGYLQGIAITTSVPAAIMIAAIPMWARLLDRAHVVRFRSIHSWVFVVSQGTVLVATLVEVVELMYVGALLQGVALGGGMLAWNLGHHDFAPASRTSQYMGVHVTLNGVRGLLAPILAVGLYELLRTSGHRPLGMDASASVQAVSLLLCVLGAIGFVRLRIRMREALKAFSRS